jgi:hypothetical protein
MLSLLLAARLFLLSPIPEEPAEEMPRNAHLQAPAKPSILNKPVESISPLLVLAGVPFGNDLTGGWPFLYHGGVLPAWAWIPMAISAESITPYVLVPRRDTRGRWLGWQRESVDTHFQNRAHQDMRDPISDDFVDPFTEDFVDPILVERAP